MGYKVDCDRKIDMRHATFGHDLNAIKGLQEVSVVDAERLSLFHAVEPHTFDWKQGASLQLLRRHQAQACSCLCWAGLDLDGMLRAAHLIPPAHHSSVKVLGRLLIISFFI